VVFVSYTPATKYETYFNDATKKARARIAGADGKTDTLIFNPYSAATLQYGAATIFYYPGDRKYAATASGSAFTITKSQEDHTPLTLAGMLTITPRAWAEPTFGGAFQVGVSPIQDRLGAYAGALVTSQQLFSFGAGIAWQKAERLAPGLSEGQTIPTADALQTVRRFGAAFYISASVNLPSGK
jgi:hypothetical protein